MLTARTEQTPLTDEQTTALAAFAAERGRTWKSQLRDIWLNVNPSTDVEYVVYALRNSHGPSWLNNYRREGK